MRAKYFVASLFLAAGIAGACGPLDRTYTFADAGELDASPSDASSSSDGDAEDLCGNPKAASCGACGKLNCNSTYCACAANIDCGAVLATFFKCRASCGDAGSPLVCGNVCERNAKNANTLFQPVLDCLKAQCETVCGLKN